MHIESTKILPCIWLRVRALVFFHSTCSVCVCVRHCSQRTTQRISTISFVRHCWKCLFATVAREHILINLSIKHCHCVCAEAFCRPSAHYAHVRSRFENIELLTHIFHQIYKLIAGNAIAWPSRHLIVCVKSEGETWYGDQRMDERTGPRCGPHGAIVWDHDCDCCWRWRRYAGCAGAAELMRSRENSHKSTRKHHVRDRIFFFGFSFSAFIRFVFVRRSLCRVTHRNRGAPCVRAMPLWALDVTLFDLPVCCTRAPQSNPNGNINNKKKNVII